MNNQSDLEKLLKKYKSIVFAKEHLKKITLRIEKEQKRLADLEVIVEKEYKDVHLLETIEKETAESYSTYLNSIPVLTIENPKIWDYKIIGLVSQSELFSLDNAVTSDKVEKEVLQKLKIKLLELGGNAVIGTRISYSFQGGKNKLINAYGTAIEVFNTDQFSEKYHRTKEINERFEETRLLLRRFERYYRYTLKEK